MSTNDAAITLDEEEILDVSLSTFYAFDHENAQAWQAGTTPVVHLNGER
jgi:hypothetical protein